MIQITVPMPVNEESKKEETEKEESKKEEPPAKTPSSSPTTLTQPIVSALVPTTAPPVSSAIAKHKLSRAQLLSRELAKCKKLRNKRKHAKCVVLAKRRYSPKKQIAVASWAKWDRAIEQRRGRRQGTRATILPI
jgi:hypothetical protein